MSKVVCGISKLKKNEKRGSAKECAKRRQVRYWGIMKIKTETLEKLMDKPKKRPTGYSTKVKEFYKTQKEIKILEKKEKLTKTDKDKILKLKRKIKKIKEEARKL